ncbi:hypothetical protein N7532_001833 [Penicillium argentinense]|uniref:rRNA adenine N(6)-methyltransferase n=1 Tax=Penicillium argentinense TaxID=1131581 RepID=A0A9W9KMU0_9EURO|nr:uncharacterized protein N7532_001833 [Penicillium argentinense]KAJ5111298.1 hypothetical protein N7532_001833 [Penicillium argentinense]
MEAETRLRIVGETQQSLQNRQPINSTAFCVKKSHHILQRASPFLLRNKPVDILDLWPGSGLLSSKINDLLKPRRHILLDPGKSSYRRFLKPLAASKPCYTLEFMDIYTEEKWTDVFKKFLPEQQQAPTAAGRVPKNDTLLVLAQPPEPTSASNHYTPARWWSQVMESCLHKAGLHQYGSVRVLAVMPEAEAAKCLPRTMTDRSRPSILTETVASQTLPLASTYMEPRYEHFKGWDLATRINARVAERSAELGITTPKKRDAPMMRLAPEQPTVGKGSTNYKLDLPYLPRPRTEFHDELEARLASEDPKIARSARAAIRMDNRRQRTIVALTDLQLAIDAKMNELARLAADPHTLTTDLRARDREINATIKKLQAVSSESHFRSLGNYARYVDESRTASLGNRSLDESPLLWDRRPFDPLRVDAEAEIYPHKPMAVLYFEADETPAYQHKLEQVPLERREGVIEIFDALTRIFTTQNLMSIADLLHAIMPSRTIEDILRDDIPSLIPYADKSVKQKCPVGWEHHARDPMSSVLGRLDYDLSSWRVRCLPVDILWDIVLAYQKNSLDLSVLQFSRLIGATVTSYRAGDYGGKAFKLR